MNIIQRLEALRKVMKENNINYYLIPTADFHQSEYVGDYFKAREYITGFTGSAGTALVSLDDAKLWTDGRYFVQVAKELSGTTIELMKIGEEGVPSILDYLETHLQEGETLACDGRVISYEEGLEYECATENCGAKFKCDLDLCDLIWVERPAISSNPVFELPLKYSGESTANKLSRIRCEMHNKGANTHILTSLDDICWMLNIRGNDIAYSPLVLSYAVVKEDVVDLYVDENKFDNDLKSKLEDDGVCFHSYDQIYEDVQKWDNSVRLLLDSNKINYLIGNSISDDVFVYDYVNPEVLMKSIKNSVEIENIKQAQIKDSVAHVRFMKWLKENYASGTIDELNAATQLDSYRAEMGNFIQPSFDPICAFGPHAAMCHYSSTEETNVILEDGQLFLTDTGAGFWEGSTDITRTYALGNVSDEIKEHFTLVAISNLRLANAKFLKDSSGVLLDMIARQPFWERGLNFNHGTGHGIGYLLNIHEGPAAIRWKSRPGEKLVLEAGMILSDEPGIYIENSHGIRLENEVLVKPWIQNEFGQFMCFETMTFIPFDLDAIKPEMMNNDDKNLLNAYHQEVYRVVSPYLNDEEKIWLQKYTKAI